MEVRIIVGACRSPLQGLASEKEWCISLSTGLGKVKYSGKRYQFSDHSFTFLQFACLHRLYIKAKHHADGKR